MALGLGLSYSMRNTHSNLSYNFTYREIPALKDSTNKRLRLSKTSLFSVLVQRESDLENLKELLENSVPELAQLHVMLFTLQLDLDSDLRERA